MLFKYPQLLWSLWLLLIPIIIHLLQFRKFKKTAFTNVKLLQKVVAKSQKSRSLKRWLLLFARMALIASLILAFAQPFLMATSALKQKNNIIYLDNSFSMQMRTENTSLLEEAVQDLIKHIPEDTPFTLFTNDQEFTDVEITEIQNELLQMAYSPRQLSLAEIMLKGNAYASGKADWINRLVLVSDFQERMGDEGLDSLSLSEVFYLPVRTEKPENISIDSAYIETENILDKKLVITLTGMGVHETIPVSLYNGSELIAKSAVGLVSDSTSTLIFTLPPNEKVEGLLEITDTGLHYDNQLYFNLNTRDKIKVLVLGSQDDLFLRKIYTDDTCEYTSIKDTDSALALIPGQDLILLNELPSINRPFLEAIKLFLEKGGSLVIIPAMDMEVSDFNALLATYNLSYTGKVTMAHDITNINVGNPLFKDVFEKKVSNFNYPGVNSFYPLNSIGSDILNFENGAPFLTGKQGLYVFSAPLNKTNSTFVNSPLVVPTLFSMAMKSRQLPALYYIIGNENNVDIPQVLGPDEIISVKKDAYAFIPLQQVIGEKTRLRFQEDPKASGNYHLQNTSPARTLSFNYSRDESHLRYLNLELLGKNSTISSIPALFTDFKKADGVTSLWKWFAILAVLFLMAEVIIQKTLK
jgi:hypothetical protein